MDTNETEGAVGEEKMKEWRKGRGIEEARGKGVGAGGQKGCNTRTSQEVTHPSTTLAQARLTSEF